MFLPSALIVAAIFLIASKRRNGPDQLERWRFVALAAGVLWPYSEVLLHLLGAGPYLQGRHGVFWSLPLLPLTACLLAAGLSVWLRQPWRRLLPAVAAGMLLTVC